jgi:hypothetical protein
MATKIITKFTIGTEEGINDLLLISREIARERFTGKVPEQKLEDYIDTNFNKEVLMIELNSMSNQYLIVYADDKAAGYAKVSSKGIRPEIFEGKTLTKIADFGVSGKYNDALIRKSLFEKCLSISTMQQVIWISEFEGSPYLDFFESYGFKREVKITLAQELSLPAVYFVKEKP